MSKKRRLGELLIEGGLLTEIQLTAALNSQKTWGGKLGSTLVRMGFVKEEDLLRFLSAQLRLPAVDFGQVKVSSRAIQLVPRKIVEKHSVMPVALNEEKGKKTVILAMADPTSLDVINEIQFQTGVSIRPVVAAESAITKAIDEYYVNPGRKDEYGYERKVDLTAYSESESMVLMTGGEEKTLSAVDGLDALALVKVLIRALERKGLINGSDLEDALKRPPKT